jgi:uncharacterized membrane protein
MNAFNSVLALHICGGTTALLIAPLAMITVKGGRWHRRWGKIYFWAMAEVALTATALCWLRSGLFLFLIAILSFYLALTGYRALYRKTPRAKPHPLDFLLALGMTLTGIAFICLGVFGDDERQRWIRLIFGLISLGLGIKDLVRLFKPSTLKQAWMLDHLTRFLSAYIATFTAFSVVNFQFLPYFWRWLGPTMVGTVGIIAWRKYYARKFKNENHAIVQ